MSIRHLAATVGLLVCAARLNAQAARPDTSAGADSAALARMRACPRAQCGLTLERGTVNGTRLRLGSTETIIPVGLTGSRVYRRLVIVPAAISEATAGRNALRENSILTTAALAMSALVWLRVAPQDRGIISTRLGIVAGIGALSILRWQHNALSADTHFENAVQLYNRELPP